MKETTETWIVTPIIRAVDNGTASSLLEDTFRPQRRLDNGFSSVAFICTKTDHYDVRDIEESLSLEDELALIRGEIWELEEQQKTWGLELRALDDPQMCYNEVSAFWLCAQIIVSSYRCFFPMLYILLTSRLLVLTPVLGRAAFGLQ